ncbi:MAG: LytTR family transcriptional regulator [Rikenellaceae bacterium]|nr:LytTR family transcriptional regulator [Rikenellaceae bacterium]
MLKPIPSFIYSKANQIAMVLFVPFFALIFINIYRPLDFDRLDDSFLSWLNISHDLAVQLITISMVVGGMIIAAASRLIMSWYTKKHKLSYLDYIVWILGEIAAMASAFTIAALFTETNKSLAELFRNSFVKTALIVIIPYVMCYIYFIWHENSMQLRTLRRQIAEDETRLQKAYIHIVDEKDEVRLSVRHEHLAIIESADNYVCIYYLNNGKIKKSMVRNTLRRVAEQLEGTNVVRCHRSYMVNLALATVMRREKEGIFIELGIEGVPDVPISRTYSEKVFGWMENYG